MNRRYFTKKTRSVRPLLEGLETRRLMAQDPDIDPIEPDINEPNDTFNEATVLSGFSSNGGTIHRVGTRSDVDYFNFTAPTSTTVSVKLSFLHSSGDLTLTMYDGARNQIGISNTSSSVKNYERITLPVQAGGSYFLKVSGIKSPDYSFSVSPLTANFDWSMPRRYGSVDQFGLPVIPNTRDYVMPNPVWINGIETPRFPVQLIVPGGPTGGDITYNYNIVGANYSTNFTLAGTSTVTDLPNGTYSVTLTTSADGSSVVSNQQITVRNYLVAAIGDSYGSGEGNPHSPAQYDWLGFATRGAIWAQGGDDQESLYHRMAHRSAKAGVAQMALELENADPKSSVTFVFLNHTGATIPEGALGWQNSGDPAVSGQTPPQLDRLADLTSGRHIDGLFMSIGGNDLGFGDILADLVKNDPLNPVGNYEGTINQIIDRSLANVADLANNRYPALAQRLSQFDVGQIYLAEYPDLTKQSDGQISAGIIDDIVPGLEVDRHELTRLIEAVMPSFITTMHTAAAKFGWNYVDGILQAYSNHGYGDWFRKASDSVVLQGPLGNSNFVTALDMQDTKGTMHPINGGLDAQRDAILGDVRKANLVTSLFSISGGAQTNNNGTYSITITNNSFLTVANASTGAIYLSGDSAVDTSDTRLFTFSVPALAPGQSVTLTGVLPSLTDPYRTPGNRVFVAPVLDVNGNVAESDEVDNRVFSAGRIGILQSELDLQPNGTGWMLNPRSMQPGQTLSGRLGGDEIVGRADVDLFAFNAAAGQTIDVDIDANGLDTYIRVYPIDFNYIWGPPVAANDNGFAPGETLNSGESYARFTVPYAGRFVVVVSHVANQNADPQVISGRNEGGTGDYSISISTVVATPPQVLSNGFNVDGNRVEVQFNENVSNSLSANALELVNETTGQAVSTNAIAYAYNTATNTASFTFGNLPNGNYRAVLRAANVRDADGTPMGSDVVTRFHVLSGDINHDRVVDFSDLLILAQNYGKSGQRFSQGNIDRSADGKIDFGDLLLLAQGYGQSLPQLSMAIPDPNPRAKKGMGDVICIKPIV